MHQRAAIVTIVLWGLFSVGSGCEETMLEPEPVAETADPTETESTNRIGNPGNSALGGAKRSAENLETELGQRQEDLIREIEDDG